MIVSLELPDEVVQKIDLHVVRIRLTAARTGAIPPKQPTRSSILREAVIHFLECVGVKPPVTT